MSRRHRAALEIKRQAVFNEDVCAGCGLTIGKHRYGDDACPNKDWTPGGGQSQWLEGQSYRAAGEESFFRWPEVVA